MWTFRRLRRRRRPRGARCGSPGLRELNPSASIIYNPASRGTYIRPLPSNVTPTGSSESGDQRARVRPCNLAAGGTAAAGRQAAGEARAAASRNPRPADRLRRGPLVAASGLARPAPPELDLPSLELGAPVRRAQVHSQRTEPLPLPRRRHVSNDSSEPSFLRFLMESTISLNAGRGQCGSHIERASWSPGMRGGNRVLHVCYELRTGPKPLMDVRLSGS